MIRVTNLTAFDAEVQKWFEAIEAAAAECAVGLAHEAFEQLLETSPQFSGDFVANWKVSKGTPDTSFIVDAVGGAPQVPFAMGSTPAMAYARARASWPTIKLGDTVFLSNSADHDEPYATKIEDGTVVLRPVNEGAEHVVRRAVATLAFTYQNIGPVQLAGLRKFGV